MSAFSLAFTSFFRMLTVFFSGIEDLAHAFGNIASVAKDSSGAYKDEAAITRAARLHELRTQNAAALANTQQPQLPSP